MKKTVLFCLSNLAICSFSMAQNQKVSDIVLFDAATTPLKSVSALYGASIDRKDNIICIENKGNNLYPGVSIKGSWNIGKSNQIMVELQNFDDKGDVTITVRLENPGADPDKGTGVVVSRLNVPAGGLKELTISIPSKPPYPEVEAKLKGMRYTPYKLSPLTSSLDGTGDISRIVVFINRAKQDWKWGIKKVVAKVGPDEQMPSWMYLPSEKFFPFIDIYGQFIHKDWPGKTKSDNDLKEELRRELADIETNPGPSDRSLYGGWKNGPRQKATGHFYVKKMVDGRP